MTLVLIFPFEAGTFLGRADTGQELQSLPNPFTSVFVGLTGERIITAQERASHAALNTVHHLHLSRINDLTTSQSRHGIASKVRVGTL